MYVYLSEALKRIPYVMETMKTDGTGQQDIRKSEVLLVLPSVLHKLFSVESAKNLLLVLLSSLYLESLHHYCI